MPSLKIATWNIDHFSMNKTMNPFNLAVMQWVANQVDILVVQEVVAGDEGPEGVLQLAETLGPDWHFRVSPPNANSVTIRERYAVIYRKHSRERGIKRIERIEAKFPGICNFTDRGQFMNSAFGTQRNPYIFGFNINGRFAFSLLTYHAPPAPYDAVIQTINTLAQVNELQTAPCAVVAGDFNTTNGGAFNQLLQLNFRQGLFGNTTVRQSLPSWLNNYRARPLDRMLVKGLGNPAVIQNIDPVPRIAEQGTDLNTAYNHAITNLNDALYAYHDLTDHIPIGVTVRWT